MAAGSRKKFALDLNDIIAFPDAAHMPVLPPEEKESWVLPWRCLIHSSFSQPTIRNPLLTSVSFTLQITADESIMRPVYAVKDKTQTRFVVALYTPNPQKDATGFKIGHTLCITSARPHQFLDGQTGFRIEDPSTIDVWRIYARKVWSQD
jgi:hypothetical protein